MLIVAPYCSKDASQHFALMDLIIAKVDMQHHVIRELYCDDHGVISDWNFCVRPLAGVATCSQLFAGVVRRLEPGTSFLWLEPDAVPTKREAFNDIETDFMLATNLNPILAIFGHDKTDQWAGLAFHSGVSVYRVTDDLLTAVDRIPLSGCHDQELGRIMHGTQCVEDTKLIRCVVGYERQEYLKYFCGDWKRVWDHFRPSAALIHGVKGTEMIEEASRCL